MGLHTLAMQLAQMFPHDRPLALAQGLGNALILAWSVWVVIAELVILAL